MDIGAKWRNDMSKKVEGAIFLIMTGVVALVCVLLTIVWHLDRLPDPINIISILTLSFGPLFLMTLYYIRKYKDRF